VTSHETIATLVMLNNFFHDLSVGILFANVMLTLILLRLLDRHGTGNGHLLSEFIRLSSRITWAALAFIIGGGIIRTLTYREFEWVEAAGKGQVLTLILKHILLVSCTVIGVGLQIKLLRKHHRTEQKPISCEKEQIA
jgi:hypothetical protein